MDPQWFEPYGGPLPDDQGGLEFDEFTCLTLSISAPASHLSSVAGSMHKYLPVLIYLHGGAAMDGTGHIDGLHSNAPLAAYSSSLSLPVITVNIGYRLNWLGSLVCQDMLDEYAADPSTSPHGPFNLTIQDQRAAFAWIHKFVGGFGGDVDNITAFGESAGSIFLIYNICGSPERLFNRVILQSGVIFGQISFTDKDKEYQRLLKNFEITGSSGAERLEKLRKIPAEALARFRGQHTFPFVDEILGLTVPEPLFPRGVPTFTSQMTLVPSCPWLEDVIIGDDFWEGRVMLDFIRASSPAPFVGAVKSVFSEPHATQLLEAYDMSTGVEAATGMDANRFLGNLSYLMGDMFISAPMHTLAKALASHSPNTANAPRRKIYRYNFALSNPFPGNSHSFSTGHHFIEILFVFLTLLDRYPRRRPGNWHAVQALETAKRWISFANGLAPWDEYRVSVSERGMEEGQAQIAICDDIRGWHMRSLAEDEEQSLSDPWGPRRYAAWRIWEAAYDALKARDSASAGGGDDSGGKWHLRVLQARMVLTLTAAGMSMPQTKMETKTEEESVIQKEAEMENAI